MGHEGVDAQYPDMQDQMVEINANLDPFAQPD